MVRPDFSKTTLRRMSHHRQPQSPAHTRPLHQVLGAHGALWNARRRTPCTPVQARAAYAAGAHALELPAQHAAAGREFHGGCARRRTPAPVRLARRRSRVVLPVLVYFHGGGFTDSEALKPTMAFAANLATWAHCAVSSVDDRLAPAGQVPHGRSRRMGRGAVGATRRGFLRLASRRYGRRWRQRRRHTGSGCVR